MTEKNLREMPIWQMTGGEFLELQKLDLAPIVETSKTEQEKKYVYGLRGLANLFGCSIPTASRIKASGKIDKAIKQIGRKIIIDGALALELAGEKQRGGRR